jgi:hypothetical protein
MHVPWIGNIASVFRRFRLSGHSSFIGSGVNENRSHNLPAHKEIFEVDLVHASKKLLA